MRIFLGIAAVLNLASCAFCSLMAWKYHQRVYAEGYEQGRKDAADWWTRAASDVEEMQKVIREEER